MKATIFPVHRFPRVDCQVCGRDVSICPITGVVRNHFSQRIGRGGRRYIAEDDCIGGGWPAAWPEVEFGDGD